MSENNIHETQPEKEHLYNNDNYAMKTFALFKILRVEDQSKRIDLNILIL